MIAEPDETRRRAPEVTRTKFHDHGVAITADDGGVVRVSGPKGFVPDRKHEELRDAFARCGRLD
jgi:hypothetical protein